MSEQPKRRNRETIEKVKIGSKDISGNTVTRIFSVSDNYLIYEIETDTLSDSLKVMINPESEVEYTHMERNYEKIKSQINEVKGELYKAYRDNSFKHLIASAISLAINSPESDEKNIEDANKMLTELKERIKIEYRKQFRNKLIYVYSSIFFIFLLSLFSLFIYEIDFNCTDKYFIQLLVYSFTAASVGGFLALSLRLKNVYTEPDLKWYVFILYSLERLLISLGGCFVVIIAIKSNIALGFVERLENPFWGFIMVSILAGYSETFVPDLLIKIEKTKLT